MNEIQSGVNEGLLHCNSAHEVSPDLSQFVGAPVISTTVSLTTLYSEIGDDILSLEAQAEVLGIQAQTDAAGVLHRFGGEEAARDLMGDNATDHLLVLVDEQAGLYER